MQNKIPRGTRGRILTIIRKNDTDGRPTTWRSLMGDLGNINGDVLNVLLAVLLEDDFIFWGRGPAGALLHATEAPEGGA